MTRHYSSSLNIPTHFHRHTRGFPTNVAHPARESSRVRSMDQPLAHETRSVNESPSRDSESERNSNQRRRIAVACSRCRKRKIKCSGDPGNGQGCQNCKSAGQDLGACQFLRVNSQTFGVVPQISWPYQANGIGSIPSVLNQSGIELGSYSTSTASPTSAYYASSNHAPASSARISSTNSYTAAPYHSMPNRSEYGSAFGSNTIDGVFDTYSISPAHYMLPGQETQTGLYGHQDNARQWPLSSRCSIGFEPDSPSRYNSSCLGYGEPVLPSGQPSNDASSYFHMGNLATTLPVPVRSTTRALPNPQRLDLLSFHPTDNIAGPQNGLAGDLGSFVAQNGTSRPSVSWGPERVTTGGSLTPTSTASSSASVYPLSISSRKTSTPPTDIRQTEFGYVTHSPPTNSATPTAESTSTLRSRASKASMEGSSLASSSFDHLSSDPFLRRDYSTSSLYTYSTGSGSKSNSVSSLGEPTLLNGQPYTSLRPPQPQDSASVDAQRRSSAETASRLAHRPSITSVGSARR